MLVGCVPVFVDVAVGALVAVPVGEDPPLLGGYLIPSLGHVDPDPAKTGQLEHPLDEEKEALVIRTWGRSNVFPALDATLDIVKGPEFIQLGALAVDSNFLAVGLLQGSLNVA